MPDLFQLERIYRRDCPSGPKLSADELVTWGYETACYHVRELGKLDQSGARRRASKPAFSRLTSPRFSASTSPERQWLILKTVRQEIASDPQGVLRKIDAAIVKLERLLREGNEARASLADLERKAQEMNQDRGKDAKKT